MGAGRSRTALYKVSGNTVEFSDGGTYNFAYSWEELIAMASEENNYLNCSTLELLQEGNFYDVGSWGRDKYFDEDSLYIANQIVEAYRIQKYCTGNSDAEFMFSAYSEGVEEKVWRDRSKIDIGTDNDLGLQGIADENTGAYARNKGGAITIYPSVRNKQQGGYYDMRKPDVAESRYKSDYNSGWSSTDSTVGTILHEYGHSVEKVIKFKHKSAYDKFLKSTNGGVNEMVSGYPASYKDKTLASKENFAEAYSAYATGTPIRKEASNYYSSFKTLMREVGIRPGNRTSSQYNNSTSKQSTGKPTVRQIKSTVVDKIPNRAVKYFTPTSTPKPITATKPTTTNTPKPPTSTKTSVRTAKNFVKSSNSIVGYIRGTKFTATLTPGIKSKGYIERTIGSTKYRININDGTFSKV